MNTNSSTTLPAGLLNGLGSECEALLGGSCKGILDGTAPITSTPVKISGPALPTLDLPVNIVLRPQPLPTIPTGQSTPITITATNAQSKTLANERLTIRLEGAISLDGSKGPMEITTGSNGQFAINIKGDADGRGKLTITSVRNPSLVVTADLTVAPQQVVLLDKITSASGKYAAIGTAIGFPYGNLPGTNQSWEFFTTSVPASSIEEPMLGGGGLKRQMESIRFPAQAGTVIQIEARLFDWKTRKVVARVVSNRLTVPAMGQTANR